ncbi:hypothetical protein HK102_000713 [Quaeritorhiza haematococci]|nr:hypothetical protein HK102_000713 [Quaeritorhiza haematococci]
MPNIMPAPVPSTPDIAPSATPAPHYNPYYHHFHYQMLQHAGQNLAPQQPLYHQQQGYPYPLQYGNQNPAIQHHVSPPTTVPPTAPSQQNVRFDPVNMDVTTNLATTNAEGMTEKDVDHMFETMLRHVRELEEYIRPPSEEDTDSTYFSSDENLLFNAMLEWETQAERRLMV